jgi:hypothetical protein
MNTVEIPSASNTFATKITLAGNGTWYPFLHITKHDPVPFSFKAGSFNAGDLLNFSTDYKGWVRNKHLANVTL